MGSRTFHIVLTITSKSCTLQSSLLPPLLSLLELLLVVITEKLLLHQPKPLLSLLLLLLSYQPSLLLSKLLVLWRLFLEKVLLQSLLQPMMLLPRFLQILSMGFWLTKKPSQPEMFHMEQLLLRQLGERRSRSQEIGTSASSHLPVKLVLLPSIFLLQMVSFILLILCSSSHMIFWGITVIFYT